MTEGSRHVLGQPVRTGLLRRTSELARRVLSDLGREEGGSVVVTRDCPWVGPLLPSLPEPVLVVPTWDAFREHAALHSVDLLVYGSDVRRSAWQLPRARENEPYRVPCVVLYPFPGAPALLSYQEGGVFTLQWNPDFFPRMPPVDKLIERLLRLRALYRDRGMIAAQSRSDCEARALVIYSDPVWADLLDSELGEPPKPAWLTYEAVGDADLARHLDGRPNVDVVVVGACVCSEQERVLHGLEEAARRGIPSILPADCAFPHLVHFSIPGIVLNWRDAIGTQGEFNYLLSGLLGGLQERKAWLHAQGRPCDHLPAAWSSAGA